MPQPSRRWLTLLGCTVLPFVLLGGAVMVIRFTPSRVILPPPVAVQVNLHPRESGELVVTGSQIPELNAPQDLVNRTASIRQGDPLFFRISVENPGDRPVRVRSINRIGWFQLHLTTPSGRTISPVPAFRSEFCGLPGSAEFDPGESMWVDSFVFEYRHSEPRKQTEMRYCFSEIGEYTLIAEYDPEVSGQPLEGVNPGAIFSDPIRITVEPAPDGEPPLPAFESMRMALWEPASDEAAAILPPDPADDAVPTRPWLLTLRTLVRTSRAALQEQRDRAALEAQRRSDN